MSDNYRHPDRRTPTSFLPRMRWSRHSYRPSRTIESVFGRSPDRYFAQLAIEYCNALVEDPVDTQVRLLPGVFNFGVQPSVAFADRNLVLDPLIDNAMNIGLGSQPDIRRCAR